MTCAIPVTLALLVGILLGLLVASLCVIAKRNEDEE